MNIDEIYEEKEIKTISETELAQLFCKKKEEIHILIETTFQGKRIWNQILLDSYMKKDSEYHLNETFSKIMVNFHFDHWEGIDLYWKKIEKKRVSVVLELILKKMEEQII